MRKALEHLRAGDPVLASIIARVGPFKMSYREPSFAALARSIVFQQLSGKAAATIFGRLEQAVGGELTPRSLLRLPLPTLRKCGLSSQKAAYIRSLAEHTESGALDFSTLPRLSDADVIAQLTQVKGVGVWTAHMFLMFALRRRDVLPVGDLGIQMAIKRHYRLRKPPKPPRIEKIARPWRPYASVACWYLWRSLELPLRLPED